MRLPFVLPSLAICLAIGFGQSITDDSLEKYRKELETNPTSSIAHYRIGEILFQQRQYQSAISEFDQALTGDREPPWSEVESHLYLATIYNVNGQYDRAQNEYRLAQSVIVGTPPPLPRGTYLVGHGVVAPQPVQKIEPEYSDEARLAGLEGAVELTGTITEQGLPRDMSVTKTLGFNLDERALAAIGQWRFQPATVNGRPVPVFTTVSVDFHLPDKQSRWHMIRAAYNPPEGSSRPRFAKTIYPYGAGISASAAEEGLVVRAIGRQGTATISFDVNERGSPVNFQVRNASAPIWGNEAIAVVRDWLFVPGSKSGVPITVPCTVDLVWGARSLTPESLRWAVTQLSTPPVSSALANVAAGEPPFVIHKSKPSYTEEARKARLEGTVVIRLLVGEDGTPQEINVSKKLGLGLDEKAIEAVSQWRFRPAVVNGLPVRAAMSVMVDFQLGDDQHAGK